MLGLKNVCAYVENKGVIKCDILTENGKIVKIGENLDIASPFSVPEGAIIVPGFIDQHVHGVNSFDVMDAKENALGEISNSLASEGTTSYLATTMTMEKQDIISSLNAVKDYKKSENSGARLLGVHLEGPFISEVYCGAQSPENAQGLDTNLLKEFILASGNNIKLITFAPEKENSKEFIKVLKENDIKASAGHTSATFSQIEESVKDGLTCITHHFNGQTPIHHRDLGTAGAGLLLNELYVEVICDFVHLSKETLNLILKNKPKDKIILITDAMRAKGLSDGESELGGQKVIVSDGKARLLNGKLAGSTLKMNLAIKNMVSLGVPFTLAIDFATKNPATHLGIFNDYGSIAIGKYADFTVLGNDYEVICTIKEGKIIYQKRP